MMLPFVQMINDNWDAPQAKKLAMLDALCEHWHYKEEIEGTEGEMVPNPESKGEFVNRCLTEHLAMLLTKAARDKARRDAEYAQFRFD